MRLHGRFAWFAWVRIDAGFALVRRALGFIPEDMTAFHCAHAKALGFRLSLKSELVFEWFGQRIILVAFLLIVYAAKAGVGK